MFNLRYAVSFLVPVLLVMGILPSFGVQVRLPYGDKLDAVAFYNNNNHPEAEEPIPLGPLSFRIAGNQCWIADSMAGEMKLIDASGKVAKNFAVIPGKKEIIDDFALKFSKTGAIESIWVLAGEVQKVIGFTPDGKKILEFGGFGDESGKFVQLPRIEIDAAGTMFLADKGRRNVSIYSPKGKLLKELPWQWSGLALNPDGNLVLLRWDEEAKATFAVTYNAAGEKLAQVELKIGDHVNPELWFVDKTGALTLSFTPVTGFKGEFQMIRCAADGTLTDSTLFPPPIAMNRYIDRDRTGTMYLGAAHYGEAPTGHFAIAPWSFPKK